MTKKKTVKPKDSIEGELLALVDASMDDDAPAELIEKGDAAAEELKRRQRQRQHNAKRQIWPAVRSRQKP